MEKFNWQLNYNFYVSAPKVIDFQLVSPCIWRFLVSPTSRSPSTWRCKGTFLWLMAGMSHLGCWATMQMLSKRLRASKLLWMPGMRSKGHLIAHTLAHFSRSLDCTGTMKYNTMIKLRMIRHYSCPRHRDGQHSGCHQENPRQCTVTRTTREQMMLSR